MSNVKKVAVIIIGIFIALLVIFFVAGNVLSIIISPSEAHYGDEVVEDIGGDGVLVATLDDCLKIGEESIPDGNFTTAMGIDLFWRDAKNITYLDTRGNKGNMIVWKTSSEGYDDFESADSIRYVSDSLQSSNRKCFVANFPDKNAVYGIIIGNGNLSYAESTLLYTILGLNQSQFSPTYQETSYSVGYGGGSSHYHTVVPDRYTLSRTDPGAYYDHYEYGDNYEIDDYLESQGYD